MKRTGAVPVMAALVAAAAFLAACGSAVPAPSATHAAEFNQALRDRLPQAVRDRGVLRVGTEASYAPMESFGPDGRTIIGADPDLGAAIGRVLGVRVTFTNTAFDTLLPEVTGGDLDLAMSSVTDTAQRATNVDFVNYFSAGTSIVVQRGNPAGITSIEDLCGKVVAVEAGTVQEDLLGRTQKNCGARPIAVSSRPTDSAALLELRTGRAIATLNDLPAAIALVTDPHTSANFQLASTAQYEPGLYGIVVAKDSPGLRDAIQGACEELLGNDVYAAILSTWGVRDGAVKQITINSGR